MEGYLGPDEAPMPTQEFVAPQEPGATEAAVPTVPSPGLERFAGLPNRKEALRGKDSNNITVFLAHIVAKQLYRCAYCANYIPVGSEHVVISRIQMARHNHHHLDRQCVQAALSNLVSVEVIKSKDAKHQVVNKKARRYRNRQRRKRS